MKILLCGLMLFGSFATFAGDCKITTNPRSEWDNPNGGWIFPSWVDRETKLENVSIEECIAVAVKELKIPYQGEFPLKNVTYKFVEKELKITGKVKK